MNILFGILMGICVVLTGYGIWAVMETILWDYSRSS